MPKFDKSSSPLPLDNWKKLVAPYQSGQPGKSIWQIINTLVPFMVIWLLMYLSLPYGYWLTLILAVPAAGFMVRTFIIQHDCGHGSFFKSKKANNQIGRVCSLITWTPYSYWQKGHAIHHASAGNLKSRGIGDIYTMTVSEYLDRSKWGRFKYRLYRNPFFLFMFVPTLLFVVLYRFPSSRDKALIKVENSLWLTDIVLALQVAGLIWLVGWQNYLLIQVPIIVIAATVGTWLFFVQHQFENTYWADSDAWDYTRAALEGSSYYKLPKVLQWFTGNIGFHHIHHLSPRIPNYMLEKCHRENPPFQQTVVLNIRTSLKSMFLKLWDEQQKKLISFSFFKKEYSGLKT